MYINTAEQISGIPSSWPGYDLTIGSRGDKVRQIQQQLNRIGKALSFAYDRCGWCLWRIYCECCSEIPEYFWPLQTGIVDYPTWYKSVRSMLGLVGLRSWIEILDTPKAPQSSSLWSFFSFLILCGISKRRELRCCPFRSERELQPVTQWIVDDEGVISHENLSQRIC